MPTPTKKLELEGFAGHGKRDARANEVDVSEVKEQYIEPPPIYELSVGARAHWKYLFPQIKHYMGTVDLDTLAAYCEAFNQWMEAKRILNSEGLIVMGSKSQVKNPAFSVWVEALTKMDKYGQKLGLCPASRTRIKKDNNAGTDDDKWAGVLN